MSFTARWYSSENLPHNREAHVALYMLREIISGSVIGASQREELRGNCSAGARLSMVLMTCGVFAGFFLLERFLSCGICPFLQQSFFLWRVR